MPPVYRGPFGKPQAERLLWRAGFGPRPGEAERLAKLGLEGAVHALMRPGRDRLKGPRPHDDRGRKLSPYDRWGHDQLWWLDRMVRTTKPLHERMTLVWHDWFATSRDGVGPAKLMLRQNQLFRRVGLELVPCVADGGHARPGDAALALRRRQREGLAERELRARADGAVHARRRPRRLHRARRARAGPGADRLPLHVEQQARPGPLPLRREAPRHRLQAHLRQARPLRLARLVPPLRPSPEAPVVLRDQALGLLHPGAAERGDASLARAALRSQRLRGRPGRRRDPAPPRALHRAAHGQVAGALPRRPAARARPRDRHRGLDVAAPARRPAALLPAERRRLGRLALARHRHLPCTLGDRGLRDAAEGVEGVGQARPGPGRQARPPRPRSARGADAHRADGGRAFALRQARSRTTPMPTGRRSSTRH